MNFLSRFFLAKPMKQQSTSYVSPQSSHLPCKIQLLCDQKLPGNGILMQKFLLNLASTIPSWNSETSSDMLAESPPLTMSTMVTNSWKDLQPTKKEHYFNATYDRQCCRKYRLNHVEPNKLNGGYGNHGTVWSNSGCHILEQQHHKHNFYIPTFLSEHSHSQIHHQHTHSGSS